MGVGTRLPGFDTAGGAAIGTIFPRLVLMCISRTCAVVSRSIALLVSWCRLPNKEGGIEILIADGRPRPMSAESDVLLMVLE